MLIVTRAPDGGLWTWNGDGPARQVAHAPDSAFALPLADGRVVTLAGADDGRLRVFEPDGDRYVVTADIPTEGGEPCHAALLPGGDHVAVVNYHLPGSVLVVALTDEPRIVQRIVLEEAGAGVVVDRQEAAHPHFALVVDHETVLMTDLGCDLVRRFGWRDGRLEPVGSCATPPGSGPRHLAVHEDTLIVSAELSNEVLAAPLADVLAGEAEWRIETASRRDLSSARDGGDHLTHPGEIVVSSDGRVYVANRGAGTLGVLDVAGGAEELTWLAETDAGGAWPQHVLLQADHPVVALRDDDLVVGPIGRTSVQAPVWLVALTPDVGDGWPAGR